ncbi:MAG: hypothetical protein ABIP51_15625, partial [Bacteroidia bacterium]
MQKNHLKYLFYFITIVSFNILSAQDFIGAKSFVKDNKVYIRWVSSNFTTFQQCLKEGFILKRILWNKSTQPDTSQFRNATFVKNIAATAVENIIWKSKIEQNIENGFLYNVLYKTNSKNIKSENYFYGLAMLACDQDTFMAKLSGLFYVDTDISREKYAYLIFPKSISSAKKIKPAILLVNTNEEAFLPNPDSLKTRIYKKEITLFWPEEKYKSFYTGYFVDRSEDGITYTQLNKKPHIQLKTQTDKTKTDIFYTDSAIKYNILYHYRVRGLSFFGPKGNYSNIVKVKLIKPIDVIVSLDSSKVFKDSCQKIFWHTVGNIDDKELKGYNVYRSINDKGPFVRINNNIIKNFTNYIDEKPETRSYYKVVAYNIYGDSTTSFNVMAMLPDIKPPLSPKNFKGKIDSNGVVRLSWSKNKEPDLKGYRVFRCNSIDEEQVDISNKILIDTFYTDKVDLNTLTENVVYYLTAVDNVANNSKYTSPYILKRPDKIKPVPV